ncbi:MAG: recombinase family protein, partial [Anaerotignum sp.]|nr:recombinase family protein [Anaerotignum sp.]
RKDPADRHHLIIDRETAAVVEEIYALYLSGLSCKMIAERLTARSVLTPSQIKKQRGEDMGRRECCRWAASTVRKILRNPVYLGHMAQGKERKVSFKEKKILEMPENKWIVVENTHDPIVNEEIFAEVGRRMTSRRKTQKQKKTTGGKKI